MEELTELFLKLIIKMLELPDANISESEANEWIYLLNIFDLVNRKKDFRNKCTNRDQ